jgi:hypothetical protein
MTNRDDANGSIRSNTPAKNSSSSPVCRTMYRPCSSVTNCAAGAPSSLTITARLASARTSSG